MSFDSYENCFDKTAGFKTYHIFGNESNLRDPLFTIVIPTYRRVEFLKDAVNSVLNQWHVPFFWDILILDNEPYDGKPNETEEYIRSLDNPRINYYRNEINFHPSDNFNRGILLAKGKWVMMLHDDDLLIPNSLHNMAKVIERLEKINSRPIGAISVKYHQFKYDPANPLAHWKEISDVQRYYVSLPTNYNLKKLTHNNILFTSHIGGDVPSNGATYNRKAVISIGGFNKDFGISADLILYYSMENVYDVFSTTVPYGFYRWGANSMTNPESTYKVIKSGFDFREYVYGKNIVYKMWGLLFRKSQYQRFTLNVIGQKNKISNDKLTLDDYNDIYDKRPNKHVYALYLSLMYIYEFIKRHQSMALTKKMMK